MEKRRYLPHCILNEGLYVEITSMAPVKFNFYQSRRFKKIKENMNKLLLGLNCDFLIQAASFFRVEFIKPF